MFDSRLLVMPLALLGLCANTIPVSEEAETVEIQLSVDADMVEAVAALAVVPALTPIRVEILDELGSKVSKSGERFALRLAEPIVIDGVEIVPAGTMGHGEVVHAKKNGSFGVPGELVLAARTLDYQGRTIRLRSLRFAEAGKGRTEGVGFAMAAAGTPAMMVGLFVRGDQVVLEKGTVASAMVAEEFVPEAEAGTVSQQSVSP